MQSVIIFLIKKHLLKTVWSLKAKFININHLILSNTKLLRVFMNSFIFTSNYTALYSLVLQTKSTLIKKYKLVGNVL